MVYTRTQSSDAENYHRSWQTGVWCRMPWMGLTCILGALLGVIASIAILVVSNDVPIMEWRFPPTVYLSISYTVTNVLIVGAFSEGVTVNWWRKAMGPRTELGDLHRYWSYGTSPVAAFLAGKKFNYIAFAALLVAVTPINGPLLQRSSSLGVRGISTPAELQVKAVSTLHESTSILAGDGYILSPTLINDRYKPIVQSFYNGDDIKIPTTGCKGDGTCRGRLRAAGFAVNCSSKSTRLSMLQDFAKKASCSDTTAFTASFATTEGSATIPEPGEVKLSVQFKYASPSDHWSVESCEGCYETQRLNCTGALMQGTCSLKAATVEYPVYIDGNKSTISLDPDTSIWDDVVSNITAYKYDPSTPHVPVGGIALALNNMFGGDATLKCMQSTISMDTTGITAQQYANDGQAAKSENFEYCYATFGDPTQALLSRARELMFRTAIAFGSNATNQAFTGTQSRTVNVYRAHYGYLAAAVTLTLVSIAVVVTTFNGFWMLGRDVSMSPLEIARAFNAPLLAQDDSNAKASELVKSSGITHVRYQQLPEAGDNSEVASTWSNGEVIERKPTRMGIYSI